MSCCYCDVFEFRKPPALLSNNKFEYGMQVSQAQQASIAEKPRQYSLQELPFANVKSIGSRGSVLMLAVRFEEVVSRGAGAAVALFSGAVIREMYRTKILSVKVSLPPSSDHKQLWMLVCLQPCCCSSSRHA